VGDRHMGGVEGGTVYIAPPSRQTEKEAAEAANALALGSNIGFVSFGFRGHGQEYTTKGVECQGENRNFLDCFLIP